MAEWDLTPVFAKYLDPQLAMGLFEFIDNQEIYDKNDMFKHKMDLLLKNDLIELAVAISENEHTLPADIIARHADLEEEHSQLIESNQDIIDTLMQFSDQQQLQAAISKGELFTPEKIATLYTFARRFYVKAEYAQAASFLNSYQILTLPNDPNMLNVLWGSLACSILSFEYDIAHEQLNYLKNYIDTANMPPIQALQQRTWFIHWGLFIYFNIENGRDALVELFFEKSPNRQGNPYLNAIQTTCPHILRYLTAAVISHRQRRTYMKELVRLIQQESYTYRDPITEFLECLYVNFDFDGAQQKLRDCEVVLRMDFFLTSCIEEFIDNARLFIFEIFCQIHECISIEMIAEKLNMSIEDAERWIVKLIRDAHFNAKIDSKKGHVIMGTQAVSQYHQLIEKTKAIRLRTEMLANNIDKTLKKSQDRSIWN